jgi:hypothetical protein
MRDDLGVVMNDRNAYEIIGKRKRGSFRSALRAYGLTAGQIKLVVDDLDCGRDVTVRNGGHDHHFRAL